MRERRRSLNVGGVYFVHAVPAVDMKEVSFPMEKTPHYSIFRPSAQAKLGACGGVVAYILKGTCTAHQQDILAVLSVVTRLA